MKLAVNGTNRLFTAGWQTDSGDCFRALWVKRWSICCDESRLGAVYGTILPFDRTR